MDHERTWPLFTFLTHYQTISVDPSRGRTFIDGTVICSFYICPGFRNLHTFPDPISCMDSLQTPFRVINALSNGSPYRFYAILSTMSCSNYSC
jgi:hypothetical protein